MSTSTYTLNHYTFAEATERYHIDAKRNLFKQITPIIDGTDGVSLNEKKEEIRNYFHATYDIYEKVFDCLNSDEAFTVRPVHKLRHPLIFYYGHTACFYINKLVVAGLTERINPKFEEMFAIGVDEMSWDDLNEAHYNWPSIEEVTEYRRLVRDRVDSLMKSGKFNLQLPLAFSKSTASDGNAFWWVVLMGCEHERIHLETASVHVRELPIQYVKEDMRSFWSACPDQSDKAPANAMVEIEGGEVVLGRQDSGPLYGWDCDYSEGSPTVKVPAFKASKFLVSNAEFYAFMKDGGYTKQQFWDEEGWSWVTWKKPEHPWFWVKDAANAGAFKLRLQTEEIPLPWNWPAEVNHLEAAAFCRWKSAATGKTIRLPTETEWLLLHDRYVRQDQHEWSTAPGNINLEHHRSSCPVDKYAHGPLYDIVGNVWQHTENAVYPYKGFKVQPFYDDFSMPTFDGRHFCMKGGAWISTGNEATRDARFAFRRHFFQFIGIRYVESSEAEFEPTPCIGAKVGMDSEVESTTHFAYYKNVCGMENLSLAIANYAKKAFKAHSKNGVQPDRALDLYCGAGRITYELTDMFKETIGSDFTARKLIAAFAMKEKGSTAYYVPTRPRGPIVKTEVRSTDFTWAATRERASFFQADPSNLHAHMARFDLIVAFNVLENIHSPHHVPAHLMGRLNAGGVLVIASTYDWQPVCQPDRKGIPLFDPSSDPTAAVRTLVEAAGGSSVADPFTLSGIYPTSEASGTVHTVTVSTFVKN